MKAIVFDLDDTLIDRELAVLKFAEEAYYLITNGENEKNKFVSDVVTFDNNGYTPRDQFFALVQKELNISSSDYYQIKELFFDRVWRNPIVLDGTVEGLEKLKAKGFKLGIVTNGSHEAQMMKIDKSGFRDLFDSIIVSESFGSKKPDPEIYLASCKELSINTENCWFVGDHPVNDIWGSKQVGLSTYWIQRGREWSPNYTECYDLRAEGLIEALENLQKLQ